MSFIDGKESHYLQVFSNVIVFSFESYKLFGIYVFGSKFLNCKYSTCFAKVAQIVSLHVFPSQFDVAHCRVIH